LLLLLVTVFQVMLVFELESNSVMLGFELDSSDVGF
jgi:hypothetical protein